MNVWQNSLSNILLPNDLDKLTSNKKNVNVQKENHPQDINNDEIYIRNFTDTCHFNKLNSFPLANVLFPF